MKKIVLIASLIVSFACNASVFAVDDPSANIQMKALHAKVEQDIQIIKNDALKLKQDKLQLEKDQLAEMQAKTLIMQDHINKQEGKVPQNPAPIQTFPTPTAPTTMNP